MALAQRRHGLWRLCSIWHSRSGMSTVIASDDSKPGKPWQELRRLEVRKRKEAVQAAELERVAKIKEEKFASRIRRAERKEREKITGDPYVTTQPEMLFDMKAEWRAYRLKVHELRVKYKKEMAAKEADRQRIEQEKKIAFEQARQEKIAHKELLKQERIIKVYEEQAKLRAILESQRAEKAAWRDKREARIASVKHREKEKTRAESCGWIEEKELESRIVECLADPIRLIGPSNSAFESFENYVTSASRRGEQDPMLQDTDDEFDLFGDKKKKRVGVSGQDILASATPRNSNISPLR